MHEMYCEKSGEESYLCTEAIFIVPDRGDEVDFGMGNGDVVPARQAT
jgi:hypothetical protein